MLDCGRNLPPDVKRNQLSNTATKTRKLQNFADLQCVDSQRLKANAHLKRTMTHKVESRHCNLSA
jgi:hypothetical protein